MQFFKSTRQDLPYCALFPPCKSQRSSPSLVYRRVQGTSNLGTPDYGCAVIPMECSSQKQLSSHWKKTIPFRIASGLTRLPALNSSVPGTDGRGQKAWGRDPWVSQRNIPACGKERRGPRASPRLVLSSRDRRGRKHRVRCSGGDFLPLRPRVNSSKTMVFSSGTAPLFYNDVDCQVSE